MNKSQLLASALLYSVLSVSQPATAEPQGGEVRAGSATIGQTLGTTTVQQLTDKAIIDWQRFNVAPDELVKFVQPNEMAVILNRVVGGDPSRILGKLQANGQLFLVNPNGVLFGPQSQVDVGSLVATTLSISNEDFLSGNYTFRQDSNFDLASVVNQGQIHVSDEGYVILTAPLVSNEGLIVANLGKVELGAGHEFTMNLDGRDLVSYQLGQAQTESGTVVLTPDAVSAMLESVVTNDLDPAGEIVEQDGAIHLVGASGTLVQSGTIEAEGGSIVVNSDQTTVMSGTLSAGSGFIDTSSRRNLLMTGEIALSQGGEWLIDPANVTIVSGTPGTNEVQASAIEGTLSAGADVTIDAGALAGSEDGDIIQNAGLFKSGGGPATLTLLAGPTGDIVLNEDITSSSGALTVVLDAGDSGGSVTVNSTIWTLGGDFFADGGGSFTSAAAAVINTGAGSMAVTAGGDISVGNLQTTSVILEAGGTLNEAGSDAGTDIDATHAYLEAAGGIGTSGALELDVSDELALLATDPGAEISVVAGGFPQKITIEAAGDVDTGALFLNAGVLSGEAPNELVLTYGGNLEVNEVFANSITLNTAGWIRSLLVDGTSDLVASSLTLNSLAGGIGQENLPLEIEAEALNLTSGTAARVEIRQNVGTLNTHGDLNIENVTVAPGSGSLFSLYTLAQGDLYVDSLTASQVDLSVTAGTLEELGSDAAADITASSELGLFAMTGIGTVGNALEVDGSSSTAAANSLSVGGTGLINVVDTVGGLHLESAFTDNGDITLQAVGGDLLVPSVTAFDLTLPRHVDLSTSGSGNVILTIIDAGTGDISIDSAGTIRTNFVIAPYNLQAENVVLEAATGIGTGPAFGAQINVKASTVDARVTGTGNMWLVGTQTPSLDVLWATTTSGNIYLEVYEGELNAQYVNAGGNVTAQTSAFSGTYDLVADDVRGVNLTLTSVGAIHDPNDDGNQDIVSTGAVTMTAATNIGTAAAPLSVTAETLTTTAGDETGLHTNGPLSLLQITTTTGGDVTVTGSDALTFDGGELAGFFTSDDVRLQTNFGSILVTDVVGEAIRLTATDGGIFEFGTDLDADITGSSLHLTATSLIGGNPGDRIELAAIGAASLTTDDGSGGTFLSLTNEFGNLDITGDSLGAVDIAGQDFVSFNGGVLNAENEGNLKFTAAGLGIQVGLVEAGDVDLRSTTGTITNVTDDGFADIEANHVALTAVGGIQLDLATSDVDVVNTGAGNVHLDNPGAGALTVDAATGSGSITIVNGGDLTVGIITAGDDVNLFSDGLHVSINQYVSTGDTLQVFANLADLIGYRPGGALEVGATNLAIEVTGNVDLDTAIDRLEARVLDGTLRINDFGTLTVGEISALDGIDVGGDITLLQTNGNLTVNETIKSDGAIRIFAGSGSVTGGVVGNEIEGTQLSINANFGVNIDTDVDNLEVLSTAGSIRVLNTGALTVGGVSLGTLVGVDARGAGNDVELQATGNIVLAERVKAVDQTLISTSNGSILGDGTSAVDVESFAIAVGGTEAVDLDTDVDFLEAASNTSSVRIDQTGAVTVGGVIGMTGIQAATTINLSASGGIILAEGLAADSVDIFSAGGVVVDLIVAPTLVNIVAPVGEIIEFVPDADAEIRSTNIVLFGGQGIGDSADSLEVEATNGTSRLSTQTGAGGAYDTYITLKNDFFDLDVLTEGNIVLIDHTAGTDYLQFILGELNANNTNGELTIHINNATIAVGSVVAGSKATLISSNDAIVESGAGDGAVDIAANEVVLSSSSGIGGTAIADRIEVAANVLTATSISGDIGLSNTGPTANTTVDLQTGVGNLQYTQGPLAVQSFSAETTDGDITVSAVESITLGPVIAGMGGLAEVSTTGGSIQGDGTGAVDVTAGTLNLTAGAGATALETDVDSLQAVIGLSGPLSVTDIQGGLNVVFASGGNVTLIAQGGPLTLGLVTVDGAVTASTDSGDLVLDSIVAVTTIDLTAQTGSILEGSLDEFADLSAASVSLTSGSGITDVELAAGDLTATVTGTGGITLSDVAGGLVATHVTTTNGSIDMTAAGGDLSASVVIAGGANRDIQLTTTGSGDILVGDVSATRNLTLTSAGSIREVAADPDEDLVGQGLTLTSGSGIGTTQTIEILAATLTAQVTGAGAIDLRDLAGGLSVTSASTTSGSIKLAAVGGSLTLTNVTATGAGADVTADTLTSGNIVVNQVTATDTITVNAAGSLTESNADAGADLVAAMIALNSATGMFSVEVDATTALTAHVTGTGALTLTDTAGGLNATSAGTTSGQLKLTAQDGNLTAGSILAGGNLLLTTTGSGDVLVQDVSAGAEKVTITAAGAVRESGSDATADVTGGTLRIITGSGIGTDGQLELAGASLVATASGAGEISVADPVDGMFLTNIQTADGGITVATAGVMNAIRVFRVGTGGIQLSTSAGDIRADNVSAGGGSVTLDAAGAIVEAGDDPAADLTATDLFLTAAGRIGGSLAIEINTTNLEATVTGAGAISLADLAGPLVVTSASTPGGTLTLSSAGTLTLTNVSASGTTTLTGGTVLANSVTSGGNLTVTSAGAINEIVFDQTPDLVTPLTLTLVSGTGIGTNNTLELDTVFLAASVSGNGKIDVVDTAGTGFTVNSATTSNGAISLRAVDQVMRLNTVNAAGATGNVILTTTSSGNIRIGNVVASRAVTIESAGSVTEDTLDAAPDITAFATSTIKANNGTIGVVGGAGFELDVQIGTAGAPATLRVLATQTQGGNSIKLTGLLNDSAAVTASLIKLSPLPPGATLFNGISF